MATLGLWLSHSDKHRYQRTIAHRDKICGVNGKNRVGKFSVCTIPYSRLCLLPFFYLKCLYLCLFDWLLLVLVPFSFALCFFTIADSSLKIAHMVDKNEWIKSFFGGGFKGKSISISYKTGILYRALCLPFYFSLSKQKQ